MRHPSHEPGLLLDYSKPTHEDFLGELQCKYSQDTQAHSLHCRVLHVRTKIRRRLRLFLYPTLVFVSPYMSPKKVNSFGNRGIATNTLLRVGTSLTIHPTTENRGSAQRHDWYYAACGSEVPWYPCALARADLLSTSAARAGRCCIRKQLFINTFPPERFTGR